MLTRPTTSSPTLNTSATICARPFSPLVDDRLPELAPGQPKPFPVETPPQHSNLIEQPAAQPEQPYLGGGLPPGEQAGVDHEAPLVRRQLTLHVIFLVEETMKEQHARRTADGEQQW